MPITAKADEDVMKDSASVSVELFQILVLASRRLGLHRLKVNVMIDKTLKTDVLTSEPRQFSQLTQPYVSINIQFHCLYKVCINNETASILFNVVQGLNLMEQKSKSATTGWAEKTGPVCALIT